MSIFSAGDKVVLKSTPYKPVMLVEEVNPDGYYLCFWQEQITGKKSADRRETYKEVLLQKYIPPDRVIYLR